MAVALKPQFVAVWLALEAFVWVRSPRERGAAPELLGALGLLTAYGIAVVLLTPQYLGLATALGPAYSHYLREPIYSLAALAPGVPLVLFALLALVVLRPYSRDRQLWGLVAAAVAAAYLGGLVQGKGFRYHFYPSLGLGFVLLGLIALDAPHSARRISERLYARVSRVLLATIVLVVFGAAVLDVTGGGQDRRRRDSEATELATFVRGHAEGKPVAVMSYNIASAFPLVTEAGVPLASRFPHLWLFAEAYWDSISAGGALRYHTLAEMKPPERFLWDAVRLDLLDAQPRLILVLRPARDAARNGLRRLHYLQYFGRDSALAALFRQYELIAEKGEYQIYQRVPVGTKRTGPAPSAEPGRLDVKRAQLQEVRLQILDPSFLAGMVVFAAVWLASTMIDRRKGRTGEVSALSAT
jgi:hypothetical protein